MMKLFFFLLFYVLIGTTGITIPIVLNDFMVVPQEVSIGLVTIVMSTVSYNASERLMRSYGNKDDKKHVFFINLVAMVIPLFFAIFICIRIPKEASFESSFWTSIVLYFMSCVFWWFQNKDNKIFENASDTMGGSDKQFK